MTRILKSASILTAGLLFCLVAIAPAHADEYVHGYYRSNGTYVNGYYRSSPDGNPYNNYSYPGNYNPYTGKTATGNPDTYLQDYYSGSSGSYNSYTPSTPTCPLNSYYDGISSCKCDAGYVVSNGSCVSGTTLCYQQVGYSSSYDSLTNTCKCSYGYALNSTGKCESQDSICSDKYGVMSMYNSLTDSCECMSGYTFNGSSCVLKPIVYSAPAIYTSSCPANSHDSLTDSTKCTCDTGYIVNATEDGCVLSLPAPAPTSPVKNGHGLTAAQVSSIIGLLSSFGASSDMVASVQAAMSQ